MWTFLHQAVQFGSRSLVETAVCFQAEKADRFQQAQRAHAIHVGSVFWTFEADRHVGLRTQVVDLVGPNLLQDAGQVGRIRQITVVQLEMRILHVRILIKVIDPLRVE